MSIIDSITDLRNTIVNGDRKKAPILARQLLEEGMDAYSIVTEGCSKAMTRVGELYQEGEYFVPEILMSAKAFEAVAKLSFRAGFWANISPNLPCSCSLAAAETNSF